MNCPGYWRGLTAGQTIEHYDTVRQRKDGSLVDVSVTTSPIRDASGHLVGASADRVKP